MLASAMAMRTTPRVLLLTLLAVTVAGSVQAQHAPLPEKVQAFIDIAKVPQRSVSMLRAGQPVTVLLDSDPAREVAVFGAVWVKAPIDRYIDAIRHIESFEKGKNFLITKRISNPPKLSDFDGLDLPDSDIADLRNCRVGSCALKLSAAALERVQHEIDWSRPTAAADAEALARSLALSYVTGYLEGGNDRLATYRDSQNPTFVGAEFRSMIERLPALTEILPDVKRYLLDYPKATLPNSESFLYWQETQFGLKPTIRINHLVMSRQPTHTVVASKMLYASHYFWTALELRVLVPDPARGEGFWLVTVNRSRSDGLSGFIGSMVRGKVRGEAQKGMLAALRSTRARLERP